MTSETVLDAPLFNRHHRCMVDLSTKWYLGLLSNFVEHDCRRLPTLLLQRTFRIYDTICLRALKSWRNGQFSLAHGTETQKLRKKNYKKNKNLLARKKRCGQKKSVKAINLGGKSEPMGRGIGLWNS